MVRRLLAAALLLVAALGGSSPAGAVDAQSWFACGGPLGALKTTGFEQITVSASAIGFTTATYAAADFAYVTIEAQPIRYRLEGVPTAAIGHLKAAADDFWVCQNLSTFRAIKSGATDSTITVTYFRK